MGQTIINKKAYTVKLTKINFLLSLQYTTLQPFLTQILRLHNKMRNFIAILYIQSFFLFIYSASAWQAFLPSCYTSTSSITTCLQNTENAAHTARTTTTTSEDEEKEQNEINSPPCYYKIGNKWKQRIRLDELQVGQKLIGERITNADLLNGKTGPKIFFECGIGTINRKGKWQMCSGMLRVAKNYSKPKVVKKKIQKLSGKEVELYVHKIRLEEGKLEVCASLEALEQELEKSEKLPTRVSVSSLKKGQVVIGDVVDVRPYGVMVDVGANRRGLLHIQKVSQLYRKFINKEEGLIEAGLERGAKIKLVVSSIEKKRLFLDFLQETIDSFAAEKAEMDKELEEEEEDEEESKERIKEIGSTETKSQDDNEINDPYADEAAAWAAYYGEEGEDDYDEDREIEDALGLGSY